MVIKKETTPEGILRDLILAERDSEHNGKKLSVLLVPEEGFDIKKKVHPLEPFFIIKGIDCQFTSPNDSRVGAPGFYLINLREISVDYKYL